MTLPRIFDGTTQKARHAVAIFLPNHTLHRREKLGSPETGAIRGQFGKGTN